MMGSPATVQICPQAYEVFAPISIISKIEVIAKEKKWQASAIKVEPGDVARFTIFIDSRTDLTFPYSLANEVPSIVRSNGGYSTSSQAKPEGSKCELPSWQSKIAGGMPRSILIHVEGSRVQKLDGDLVSLGLDYKKFSGDGEVIYQVAQPLGFADYKMQSIFYRLQRGDYEDARFGIELSRTDMMERDKAKWGPSE